MVVLDVNKRGGTEREDVSSIQAASRTPDSGKPTHALACLVRLSPAERRTGETILTTNNDGGRAEAIALLLVGIDIDYSEKTLRTSSLGWASTWAM